MARQSAVFINATDCEKVEKLNEILNELLNHKDDLSPHVKDNEMESYLWKADTKYYNAEIDLTILKKKSIMSEEFSEKVEAVMLYFDSGKNFDGLKNLDTWLPFLNVWEPGIKLAVCKNCDREGEQTISRVTIQEWCLDHEFELVELEPDMEDYDEFEDVGVKRIKSALLAHMWSDMVMKDPQSAVKKIAPTTCATDVAKEDSATVESPQNHIEGLLSGLNQNDDILGDESEQDNFEELFSQLKVMKDQASSMPENDRRKYAENMVKTFWNALGGDEDEFDGLSSDEDNKMDKAGGT